MQPEENDSLSARFSGFEFQPRSESWGKIEEKIGENRRAGFLSAQFEGLMVPPPKKAWKGIVNALYPHRRKRIAITWWTIAACIGLLFAAGAVSWYDTNSLPISEIQTETRNQGPLFAETEVPCPEIPQNQSKIAAIHSNNSASPIQIAPNQNQENSQNKVSTFAESLITQPPAYDIIQIQGIQTNFQNKVRTVNSQSGETSWVILAEENPSAKKSLKKEKWIEVEDESQESHFGFEPDIAMNLSPTYVSRNGGTHAFSGLSDETIEILPGGVSADLANSNKKPRFLLPLIVGGKLNVRLAKRWSVGAGLAYTFMNGVYELNAGDYQLRESTTYEYLGLTTSANFDLYRKKRFALYTSAGLQYDFGLRTTTKIKETIGPESSDLKDESGPLGNQASVNLGIGANYRVFSFVNLYLQASASHYFYQSHYNLWSNQPVWPSLQAGLRFDL